MPARVLVVTPWYPTTELPVSGIFVRDQVRALAAAGHSVCVLHAHVASEGRGSSRLFDMDEGVTVVRVLVRGGSPGLHQLRLAIACLVTALRLRSTRDFPPTIVHGHTDRAGLSCLLVSGWLRLPFGLTEHSSEWIDPLLLPSGRRLWLARFVARRADFLVAVSAALAEGLRRLGGNTLVSVVPNPIDVSIFAPRPRSRRIGNMIVSTGGLVGDKDFGLLMDAVAQLSDRRDVALTLIGDGAEHQALMARAEQLGISSRVHFAGWQPRDRVAELVASADVYVCSSRVETFGVAVAEAMAAGVPVVSTRCGGPDDFVPRLGGVLVEGRTPGAMAKAIEEVLESPMDAASLADRTRQLFAPERIAQRLTEIYAAVGR